MGSIFKNDNDVYSHEVTIGGRESAEKILGSTHLQKISLPDGNILLIDADFDTRDPRNFKANNLLTHRYHMKAGIFSDALLCEPGEIGDVSDLEDYPAKNLPPEKKWTPLSTVLQWLAITGIIALPVFIGWLSGYVYDVINHDAAYAIAHPNGVAMASMGIVAFIMFCLIMYEDAADFNVKKKPAELARRFILLLVIPVAIAWLVGFFVDMSLNGASHALVNPNIPAIAGALIEGALFFVFILAREVSLAKDKKKKAEYSEKRAAKSSS